MNAGQEASADAESVPSLGKQVGKHLQGAIHWEASLSLVKIPRCAQCEAPNRERLDHCARCGAEMPAESDHQRVSAVLTDGRIFPWHARFLLWCAAQLNRLAAWLENKE